MTALDKIQAAHTLAREVAAAKAEAQRLATIEELTGHTRDAFLRLLAELGFESDDVASYTLTAFDLNAQLFGASSADEYLEFAYNRGLMTDSGSAARGWKEVGTADIRFTGIEDRPFTVSFGVDRDDDRELYVTAYLVEDGKHIGRLIDISV